MPNGIEGVGKGAVRDKEDLRDYKFEDVMGAPVVDWSQEFRLPTPPQKDQGISDSCVSHAWSYYHWQLHGKDYSRRDLFCRIALDYGAQIRDGGWQVKNNGQATHDEVPDPSPQTPQNMRDKSGTQQAFRDDDKEKDFYVIQDKSIDGVALAIEQFKGVVFGLTGSNAGWQDMTNPRPPKPGEETWGHALYAMGHHIHDGYKCIIARSSWSEVPEHHIKDNYFLTGNTFNAWTLIPKEQFMFKVKKVKVNGAFGVAVITPNMVNITLAEDEAEWKSYSKPDSYAVHTVNADGTTDWTVDQEIDF